MKKIVFFLLAFAPLYIYCQTVDTIPCEGGKPVLVSQVGQIKFFTYKDGAIKNCLLHEINGTTVVFEKNGSLHDILIDDIERIESSLTPTYAIYFVDKRPVMRSLVNGESSRSVVYKNETAKTIAYTQKHNIDYYALGKRDGKKYYMGYGTFAGTLASGILFPFGWLPTTIIAAVPVNMELQSTRENPNDALLHSYSPSFNKAYYKGYRRGAHQKKVGRAIGGFFVGIGADALFLALIIMSL